MADGDGVGRPVARALGSSRDEAEIDQRDLGAPEDGRRSRQRCRHGSPNRGRGRNAWIRENARERADLSVGLVCRLGKRFQQKVDVALKMRPGEGEPHPGRPGRHGRRPDRGCPEAALAQPVAESERRLRRASDQRHDLGRGRAGIIAQCLRARAKPTRRASPRRRGPHPWRGSGRARRRWRPALAAGERSNRSARRND